jgi:hypothetical protein
VRRLLWACLFIMVAGVCAGVMIVATSHLNENPPVTRFPSPEGADTFDADAGCCTIPDGLWIVGKDIVPGKYRAIPAAIYGCYWERRSTVEDTLDGIIVNGFTAEDGVATVTIIKTDKAFRSSGCRQWRLVK